jgi:hypothetical protein
MGFTVHGIKYPELPDPPNVPDDIGAAGKLDATTQAWLAQLDATNLADLAAQNLACANTETNVTAASNGVAAGITRQAGQQSQINAISGNNDSITNRLNARDTTLAADSSTVQGYAGQIAGLQTLKGRGLLGIKSLDGTTISTAGNGTFGSITFNDPAPSATRMYRAAMQVNVINNGGGSNSFIGNLYLYYATGTTFATSRLLGSCPWSVDYYTVTAEPTWIDVVFSAVTDAQWTVWAVATQIPGIQYQVGRIGDFLTLEDVGLSL